MTNTAPISQPTRTDPIKHQCAITDRIIRLRESFLRGMTSSETAAMVGHLARYFRIQPAASPATTLARVLDVALGM